MTIDDIDGVEVFFNIKDKEGNVFGHRVTLTDEVKKAIVSTINYAYSTAIHVSDTPTYRLKDKVNETGI